MELSRTGASAMFARVTTVLEGIEARPIDVQVKIGPGMPAFTIVGRPERLWLSAGSGCATANGIGLARPPKAQHRRISLLPISRSKGATIS